MRVIAGKFGGRHLRVPKTIDARPMTDRVREAVFSTVISMHGVEERVVLDLYSGTGSLGIESLSRGATKVVFVEKQRALCDTIKSTLTEFEIMGQSEVYCLEVEKALSQFEKSSHAGKTFDLVFITPPYPSHPGMKVLEQLLQAGVLSPHALVIVETEKNFILTESAVYGALSLVLKRSKSYGGTTIWYYELRTE